MAGSLGMDDKLLGEKTNNYCSSSEESDGDEHEENDQPKSTANSDNTCQPEINDYSGHCTNTGPKGVINDWRRFRQLETEKQEEQDREKAELLKKLSITCRSHLNDEEEKAKDQEFLESLEEFEDGFLKEYRLKRLEEMRKAVENIPQFGTVKSVSKEEFVAEIDKEKPQVTVIVHIYEEGVPGCNAMNGCISCLAEEYPTVKFCKIKASAAKMSLNFASNGVPALLVYKKGELIGSFIKLCDEFGEDFFSTDVESFLQQHGFLPQDHTGRELILKSSIRDTSQQDDDDSD